MGDFRSSNDGPSTAISRTVAGGGRPRSQVSLVWIQSCLDARDRTTRPFALPPDGLRNRNNRPFLLAVGAVVESAADEQHA